MSGLLHVNPLEVVARDGIEPPTPAFSNLKKSNRFNNLDGADGTVSTSKWLKDAARLGSILGREEEVQLTATGRLRKAGPSLSSGTLADFLP